MDEVTKGKKAEQLIESEEVYRTTPSGEIITKMWKKVLWEELKI